MKIIATGASAFRPNIEGIDSDHVFFLRSVQNALSLKNFIETADKITPNLDSDMAAFWGNTLLGQGIKILKSTQIVKSK